MHLVQRFSGQLSRVRVGFCLAFIEKESFVVWWQEKKKPSLEWEGLLRDKYDCMQTTQKAAQSVTWVRKTGYNIYDNWWYHLAMLSQPRQQFPFLMEQKTVSYIMSVSTKSSVWAQVLRVLRRWDVSVGVGLEGGGEILLVIRVVYAVLGLVFLNAVDRAVGGEREDGGGQDLVEVLGSVGLVSKAVQVLCLCVVRGDGGEDGARWTRVLVDRIHHIWDSVLVHVVWKKASNISEDTGSFLIKCIHG